MAVNLSPVGGVAAQFFTNTGAVLTGGKLYTYAAGTTTPQATYTTSTGNVAWTNPVVLDAAGRVPNGGEIWLTNGVIYKFVLTDSNDVLIGTYDNVIGINAGDASQISYTPAGTGAVTTTVQAKLRQIVSVMDFGAVGDGVTDDTAAIRAAVASLTSGGELYFPNPSVSYLITDTINITTANITLTGTGNDCHVQMYDGGFTGFQVTGVSGVTIRGFKFSCKNQTNLASYKAAVMFYNSSYCYLDKCSAFYIGFWGFALWNSNNCSITNCSTGDWWGSQQDSANIVIFKQSSYNLIQNNTCAGTGADHGIFVQDPYAGDTPTGNIIDSNRILGTHNAYGIVIYVTTVYDTKHIVTNNYIEGVTGTQLVGQASGAGIYLQSAGGTVCANNEVYNCCRSTNNFGTLNIAHITATTGDEYTYPGAYNFSPIIIANNKIRAVRGPGIWAGTSYASITIDSNAIINESTASSFSQAIIVSYCNNARVSNNTIIHSSPTTSAINVVALGEFAGHTGLTQSNMMMVNNFVKTVGDGIVFSQVSNGALYDVTVMGNNVQNTTGTAYFFEKCNRVVFSGNQCTTDNSQLYVTDTTYLRGSDNNLYTNSVSGGYTINLVNTCTGSLLDKTNRYNGVMNNIATGFSLEFYANAVAPMSGVFAVNDRVVNSEASLGEPSGWVCTVAGSPGTWAVTGQCGYRTGTTAPSVNAYFIGEEFLDTTNNKWYKSKNVGTGASDWVALN